MIIEPSLGPLALLWVVVAAIILFTFWWRKTAGAGLVFAYLLNLGLIHWSGAVIHILPWFSTEQERALRTGFTQSTYGMLAFAAGVLVVAPIATTVLQGHSRVFEVHEPDSGLPMTYILIGVVNYALLRSSIGKLPTLNAMVGVGWHLMLIGIALACWQAWKEQRGKRFAWWLFLSLGLPFLTIVLQGFLGVGAKAFFVILAFILSYYRPRWKLIIGVLLLAYLALSLFITYRLNRPEIRSTVWGGAPLLTRVRVVFDVFDDPEWFDPHNRAHLRAIDERLNQNYLVGFAVDYIGRGYQDFAGGETLWQALIALIPRVLWPGKPVVAGSMGLVSEYTGIPFAAGTSVGIGQVMEFYINFGTMGVVLGFLLIGTIVAVLDSSAAVRLSKGDLEGFVLRFLPGVAFLNVQGSLVEVVSSAAMAVVVVLFTNRFLIPFLQGGRLILPHPRQHMPGSHSTARQFPKHPPRPVEDS